jgi:4-diphosphocytidyl-2-C-methyl-D-erythritol kinase
MAGVSERGVGGIATLCDVTSVTVRVPAKVNLQLSVGPLRDDGYHDLVNVFHAVSLFDEVTATPAGRLTVRVSGESIEGVPTDGDNLAARAARLLADRTGNVPAVDLHIRKAIPVAGGMAGGSADAAAALVACNELWQAGLERDELVELACELGSDVPFALLGGTAVGLGRGERLTSAMVRGRFHWVFACADGGLSTPAVYAECDRLRSAFEEPVSWPHTSEDLMAALATGDAKALGKALHNDLQPAALTLRGSLRRTLTAGREFGALGSLVSGSGPTCAFLTGSEAHAVDLAVGLSGMGVARSVERAYGPVAGATVL